MMDDADDIFRQLFYGNFKAVGAEEGGCIRLDDLHPEFWQYAIDEHLDGTNPVGVYPIMPLGTVFWGCVDFDEGEDISWIHARNLAGILSRYGISAWVERSRSKGYHVWVFVDVPVEASVMRNALLYACQVVKAPTKEINPKQSVLAEGELGNYVRLPYPGREDDNGRRCFIDSERSPIRYETAMRDAWDQRTPCEMVTELSERYVPPAPPRVSGPRSTDGTAWEKLTPYIRKIVEEGPLDGDRSGCLYKIAQLIAEEGIHTAQECFEILEIGDEKWGKFSQRKDKQVRLEEIVRKTWQKHFASATK